MNQLNNEFIKSHYSVFRYFPALFTEHTKHTTHSYPNYIQVVCACASRLVWPHTWNGLRHDWNVKTLPEMLSCSPTTLRNEIHTKQHEDGLILNLHVRWFKDMSTGSICC